MMTQNPQPGFSTYARMAAVLEPSDPPTVQVVLPLTNQGPAAACEVQFGMLTNLTPPTGNIGHVDIGEAHHVFVTPGETIYVGDILGVVPHGYSVYAKIKYLHGGQEYVTQATSKLFRSFASAQNS